LNILNLTSVTRFISSYDNSKLVIGDEAGLIKIVDGINYHLLYEIKAYNSAVLDLALDTDDGILISISFDNLIKVFDFRRGDLLGSIQEESSLGCITALDVSPDNKYIVVTDVSGIVRVWDIRSRELIKEYTTAFGTTYHTAGYLTIQNHMLYGKERIRKSEIDVCDILTGNVKYRIEPDLMWDETIIDISHSGEFAACSYNKNDIRVIHLPTGEIKTSFQAHNEFMTHISFINDTHLMSISEDGTIKIWHLDKSELLYDVKPENTFITNVLYSAQNRKLGYINSDNNIVFHEINLD